ncbi:hypothetical protein [Roseivirga sp.]|uniref:hypothetical protein n=1 Tax=Roseivirga sp. TaxID=1964215 RepID=UPI003B52DA81
MPHFLEEEKSMLLKTRWSGHFSQLRIQCRVDCMSEILDDFLQEMIHKFWTLKGLIDFKILSCKSASEVVLFWSFKEEKYYQEMKSSQVWTSFQHELSHLITSGKVQWTNILSNTYEIIE